MSYPHNDIAYLQERLKGPILEEIIDPKDHLTDDIMKSYFREILFLAGRYTRPTVDFQDLVDEGIMGLLDAITRFDITKANGNPRAFHNLAIVRIKSFMFEFFLSNNSRYHIPHYMSRAINLTEQIRNIIDNSPYQGDCSAALLNFECEDFEDSSLETTVEKIGAVKRRLKRLAESLGKTYEGMVLSVLKVNLDIENYEVGNEEIENSPEELAGDREYMEKFLDCLNPNARAVITKILQGKTLEEAGAELGICRERARQIKEETLLHLIRTPMYRDSVER
jgi:RNA polymerase sigma factor (sigma-70 family)